MVVAAEIVGMIDTLMIALVVKTGMLPHNSEERMLKSTMEQYIMTIAVIEVLIAMGIAL